MPSMRHPYERTISKLRFNKSLKENTSFLKWKKLGETWKKLGRNLKKLHKALSFLLAFEQILDTCLSNSSLLSNILPRSLTSLLSQTIFLSNFVHICTFLFPDIKRWHLSVLSFI